MNICPQQPTERGRVQQIAGIKVHKQISTTHLSIEANHSISSCPQTASASLSLRRGSSLASQHAVDCLPLSAWPTANLYQSVS